MIDFHNIPVISHPNVVPSSIEQVERFVARIRDHTQSIEELIMEGLRINNAPVCSGIYRIYSPNIAPLYLYGGSLNLVKEAIESIMNETTSPNAQTESIAEPDTPNPNSTQEASQSRLVSQRVMTQEELTRIIQGDIEEGTITVTYTESETPESFSPQVSVETPPEDTSSEDTSSEDEGTPIIPKNPVSTYAEGGTARFSGADWFKKVQHTNFLVAGAGGIGSNVIYMLARLKPNTIYIFDDDKVEAVNMAGQLFGFKDIGLYKGDAIAQMTKDYTEATSVFSINSRYTENSSPMDIMICGFDNMRSRYIFFNSWASFVRNKSPKEKAECLFIDGRLNAEMFQIFCIRGDDEYSKDLYREKYLFSDSEVADAPCSYKQTTYCACMIASMITNLVINHISNLCNPVIERDLPFFTEYKADLMYLKTEK